MDKKKNGSILIMIGMIMFIISFLSFLNHVPSISLPPTNDGDINIPNANETIVIGNNQTVERTGHVYKLLLPEDNDSAVPFLDALCAITNLISALISGYVAHTGYKMMCLEESRKKSMLREQKSSKDTQDSKN